MLAGVCQQLDLVALVRFAETCKRFHHGDSEPETEELPTKSPVVTVLCEHAFDRLELIPRTRPFGCCESWVVYLARSVRQCRCREASLIAARCGDTLIVDASGSC
jgi:hypothetical protein